MQKIAHKWLRLQRRHDGFSIMEVVVTMVIVIVLGAALMASVGGLRSRDDISRVIQLIHSDVMLIRSRAISTNQDHRISFSSATTWIVQYYDDGTTNWEDFSDERQMPINTSLTASSYTNAASNLEAMPKGLYNFANSMSGEPYVTVQTMGETMTKSINVAVGGAVSMETN